LSLLILSTSTGGIFWEQTIVQAMLYEYEVAKLRTGANYGNIELFSRADQYSNLAGLWCAEDDQFYCGHWVMRYNLGEQPIPAERTSFRATHQTTTYHLEDIEIQQTYFVPLGVPDLKVAYTLVRLRNFGEQSATVTLHAQIHYPWIMLPEFSKLPDMTQKNKKVQSRLEDGLVITETVGRPEEVRVLGTPHMAPQEANFDARRADLRYEVEIEGRGEVEIPFILAISGHGEEAARQSYERSCDHHAVFETTTRTAEAILTSSDVLVPDPVINRAVKWAKINILREEKRYPIGYGFTNDPPQDILVVRDIAWFSIGSDYITPEFSHGMLRLTKEYGVEETGQLTEYLLACENPPSINNYGLNINDDTPLFIFAIHHHFALTGDREFLTEMYETVTQAADWILAQRRAGLIWCTSEESNAWGIASWRNMIPEYQISGAVTEINAECYMALRLAGRCCEEMGDHERAQVYLEAALQLKEEMNRQLVSEVTGLYVLNIDNSGNKHHLITGDLIFPVMFGVADDAMRRKILNILYSPEFWTDFGVRTVGRHEPEYDPEFAMRLQGGIWPNLTAWVAYGSRLDEPEKMIEAMRNIYRISEVPEPKAYKNVVPGTFPECLHGESFQSRGMAQSPWVAPTYLWLTIDGVLGLRPGIDTLRIQPHLPDAWQWCAIRNIPFQGGHFSYFVYSGTLYTDRTVESTYPVEVYERDITAHLECNAYALGFQRGNEIVIFVGSDERQGIVLKVKPPLLESEQRFEFVLNPSEAKVIRLLAPTSPSDVTLSISQESDESLPEETEEAPIFEQQIHAASDGHQPPDATAH
jgi:glycogen debranching enzyme